MCKAFSALVLKSGEVKWEMGIDSHSSLQEKFGLREIGVVADPAEITIAKIEITPDNGNYLHPKKWNFKIDESITPSWWTPLDEKAAWKAHAQWKRQLNRLIVRKPIVYPFNLKPPKKVTNKHLSALKKWASVGASVGDSVWASVGASVGASVWDSVWASVGASVWASVGDSVWAYTGSFLVLPRKAWKYTENIEGDDYPFEPCAYLWESGLVPSFDGKKWRLHGGKDAKIVWEGEL